MTFEDLQKGVALFGCELEYKDFCFIFKLKYGVVVKIPVPSDMEMVMLQLLLMKDWVKLLSECVDAEKKKEESLKQ